MNTPLKISKEAKEAAAFEIKAYDINVSLHEARLLGDATKKMLAEKDAPALGHFVQLAINKAIAEAYRKAANVYVASDSQLAMSNAILNLIPKE